jgi:hypothetical protein
MNKVKSFKELNHGDIFYHVDDCMEIIEYEFFRMDKYFDNKAIFIRHFLDDEIKDIYLNTFKEEYFKTRKTARKQLKIKLETKLKEYEQFKNDNFPFTKFEDIIEDQYYYMADIETFSVIEIYILKKLSSKYHYQVYYIKKGDVNCEQAQKEYFFPTIYKSENDVKALIYQWILETKENYGL